MFTGIVTEIGDVVSALKEKGGVVFVIRAPHTVSALSVNDSVSVSGVCQTVIHCTKDRFTVQAVEETLRKTTLGSLGPGSRVNLELPLRLSDRLGGHLVQGHVDCVGKIARIEKEETNWLVTIEFPPEFRKYVIPVGSIAVDGVSLTIARTSGATFTVAIIPHTLEFTTMSEGRQGTTVNLEFDLIGKYLENLVVGRGEKGLSSLTEDRLKEWGY